MVEPKEAGWLRSPKISRKSLEVCGDFLDFYIWSPEELLFYKMPPTQGIEISGSAPYS